MEKGGPLMPEYGADFDPNADHRTQMIVNRLCEKIGKLINKQGHSCEVGYKFMDFSYRNVMAHLPDRVNHDDETIISDLEVTEEVIVVQTVTYRFPNYRTRLEREDFDLDSDLTAEHIADIILREWVGIKPPKTLPQTIMEMMADKISNDMEKGIINEMFNG